ncbi:MAG TPA: LacI family DNA-binding transcriptional regulator [Solirubrobacteraceae bacterium]|nr:LacI family DNA-binding transcriptional regulator [Solirubrobacteraceae bacterium]
MPDAAAERSDRSPGPPRGGAANRVTLAAIAERTGTSVPTVSKVLNERSDVSPATRARVKDALAAASYRPRRRAGARRGPGRMIELVIRGLDSPWASVVLDAVEHVAHEMGHGMVVTAAHGRNRPSRAWLDALIERRSAGAVLVVSDLTLGQVHSLDSLGIPYVFLDPLGAPPPDTPTVGATNWAGGLAATEHLLELGHERVAVISGPRDVLCSRARVDGYRAALHNRGMRASRELVRFAEFNWTAGLREATSLLTLREPPTAIFCASDMIALGVYEAAHRLRLAVPASLSVVGFDDLPLAGWMQPSLTTVRQPLTEMASLATRMLFSLIAGESLDAPQVEVATRLVVRGSTAGRA